MSTPPYADLVATDYQGERYVLGRTPNAYAIWDSAVGGQPLQVFAGSPEGWAEAWTRFGELEGPDVAALAPQGASGTGLEPLRAGQIVGRALRIWRTNLRSLVAISATLLVPAFLVLVPLVLLNTEERSIPVGSSFVRTVRVDTWAQIVSNAVRYLVIAPLLTAAMLTAVALALLGRRPGVAAVYRAARGRWLSILWVIFLSSLATAAPLVPAIFLFASAAVVDGITIAVVAAAVAGLAATVVAAFVGLRLMFAPAVLVLENRRGSEALRRSWRLVRGLTWKVLGTSLLMGLILLGIFFVLGIIVTVIFLPSLLHGDPSTGSVIALLAVSTILSAVVQIAVMPLTSLTTVLLYVDARVRKEAFDRGALEAAVDQLLV